MQIESQILEFKNTNNFSTEHIETLLSTSGKTVLRWAIVDITPDTFKLSATFLK